MSHTSSILLARGHRRARRRAQNGLWQLASVVVSSVLVAPAFADQRVDCSGLDRFRVVVAQLQSGEEPAKPQWDALFETPGYAVLERQGQRPMYERVFSLAFLPANAEKREEALRNSPEAPLIRHAMRFIDEAEALASYEKHVRELPLDPLFRRSARLLPEGLVDQATPPTVAALIFQLDAYGTSVIAVDLFAAKEMGIEGLIAHEAHHYYTEKVSRLNTPPAKHDAYDLIHSIDQLRLEGIADLIDKPELFEADRRQTLGPLMHGYVQRYLPLMQQANENLARIDSLLQEAARDESQWKKCGAAMWASLPLGPTRKASRWPNSS